MTARAEIPRVLVSFFGKKPEIAAVYLFGSLVTGGFSEESDVDVAVLFNPGQVPGSANRLELQEILSEATGRTVDLVCLNQASPILAMQVLSKGEKILENNSHEAAKFQIKTASLYHDFKQMRKAAEQNFLKGRVYG